MKKCFVLSLLFGALSTIGYAQESNNKLLDKLVEKQVLTQDEANQIAEESDTDTKIKSNSSFDNKLGKVREAFNTPYMKFGGYGLLMYKYSDVSKTSNVKHNLEPRVIFLNVGGELTSTIKYFFMAELVKPMVHEFYGEWTPAKAFNFRAGQFKVPFTLENQIAFSNLETVMNSRSIGNLVGSDDVLKLQNGKANGGRDIGAQISGSLLSVGNRDLIQYAMGIFQGSGISSSELNNSKDFAGTVMLQPAKGFRIGGGVYFGEATYKQGSEMGASNHVRNRWVVSADYNSDRFSARSEWTHGKDGLIDKEGLYGTITYYLVPKKFNAVAKVDYYNQNKSLNQEVMDYTIAANYYFYKNCRVQLNYTYSDYSKQWGDKNSNTVYGQLQFVF